MDALQILKEKGFTPITDLAYCTESGIEYYIGFNKNKAAVAAFMHDEAIFWINKDELREMSFSTQYVGQKPNNVTLFTNYGLELSSRYEKPETVGFNKIEKIIGEF